MKYWKTCSCGRSYRAPHTRCYICNTAMRRMATARRVDSARRCVCGRDPETHESYDCLRDYDRTR